MGDDITIGVTEIVNNIEVTAQPSDQVIDIDVVDNSDDVTLNITPTVIEININKGSSFARWGTILGNLPDQEDLQNVLNLKADLVGGLVPASQLPSYVDDIVEVANYAALPVVGETGKIYLTLDNNKIFRWSGSVYIEIAANNAIWGAITGTLSSQTDLQTALDTKALKTITITPNAPLSGGGDLSANRTISISQSNATTDGYLSSTDWTTFNNKQGALNGTGFVKISGSTISYDNSTYALDSVVVKLTGDQTITGIKTFSSIIKSNILLINESGGFSGVNGYTQLGGTADYFQIVNSGGSKQTKFIHTGVRNITMPSSDGTMALTSQIPTVSGTTNYIPKFTGASAIGNSLIFDNGTNVGIGTVSPGTKLDVRGNINIGNSADTNTNSFVIQSNKGIFQIDVDGATSGVGTKIKYTYGSGSQGSLRFVRALDEDTMILAANGNVGIGTTSPSGIGTVLNLYGGSSINSNLVLEGNSGNSFLSILSSATNGVPPSFISKDGFRFAYASDKSATGFAEHLRITSGGSVGIGTTSPPTRFSVVQNVDVSSITSGSMTAGISLLATSGIYGLNIATSNSTGTTFIQNHRNDGNTTVYPISINPNGGNVGIGTSSPVQKLHVEGSTAVGTTGTEDILILGRALVGGVSFQQAASFKLGRYQNAGGGFESYTRLDFALRDNSAASNYNTNTTVMTLTNAGNVGIGTTSPANALSVFTSSSTIASFTRDLATDATLNIGADNDGTYLETAGIHNLRVLTNGSERMRITSGGRVFINTTSGVGQEQFCVNFDSNSSINQGINIKDTYASGNNAPYIVFRKNDDAGIGSISRIGTTSAVAYNTTSDYRLKEDLKEIKGLEKISKIKVYDFKWKDDNSRMDGVIAHELQEVIPYAVTGEKDAKEMQSVDYSKLVPILVQAIQELKAEIEILKNK